MSSSYSINWTFCSRQDTLKCFVVDGEESCREISPELQCKHAVHLFIAINKFVSDRL